MIMFIRPQTTLNKKHINCIKKNAYKKFNFLYFIIKNEKPEPIKTPSAIPITTKPKPRLSGFFL